MIVHEHSFRVRYYETDAMGVAHHSSYIRYLETARTEYLRAVGQDYAQIEAQGVFCVLREVRCEYISPARFDEELITRVWINQMTPTRLYYRYEIISGGGRRICVSETEHVFVNNTTFAPVSLLKALPETYAALQQCTQTDKSTSSGE